MNASQRRFLVASLRSLSVFLAIAYVVRIGVDWYSGVGASTPVLRFFSPPLFLVLLSAGASMWLAKLLSLGSEVRVLTVGPSSQPPPEKMGKECPNWPTILSWLVTDLDDGDAQRVSTHVSTCDNCRKRLALMNAVQEMSSDRGR